MKTSIKIPLDSVFTMDDENASKMRVKKIFDERGVAYSTYDVSKSKSFEGLPQSTVIYQISNMR